LPTLRGIISPVDVYRVLGESLAQTRLDIAATRGLTPLVGREQEVGLLRERWAQVKEGLGQVVLLSGEAGIGKSRLVQVVKELVAGEPHLRWECRSSPYYQNSAFYPILDLFERTLRFQRDDTPEARLGKLEEALERYGFSLPDVVPLVAALLSLPVPDRYPPVPLTPQRQRQKTLEVLLAILLGQAGQQPVLFIVEDLHWVDPSTLELLGLLIDQVPTTCILALFTARPEFRPPWDLRAHLTHLTLSRLPLHQAEVMVGQVASGKALPAEVRQQVVAKTDGVPLFVEELTKMVLESELLWEREDHYELRGPLPSLAIPATLQDSLMARLDRLAAGKAVAQLGATLGRAFPYEVLRAVSTFEEGPLQYALAQLVEAELLYQQGVPPQATYRFKHALIQDTAYQSLLKRTRQQYHQRIAQVLEARFPETAETQPELLAHHYTEAGLSGPAVGYWQQAGQRAIQRSAHVEAISHLTKGGEMLKTLPDTSERTRHELDLQTALGQALMATKGYAAPEVAQAYTRAREVGQQVGEIPRLFPVLWGLWAFYDVRAEYKTARELGEQLLTLAQSVQDPAFLLEAHRALGITLFFLGEFAPAREPLEQGMALYDPQQHRSHAFRYGIDPGVSCLSFAAQVLWSLGYPDQALQSIHAALLLARELAYPFSLAGALVFTAELHQFRREAQTAQKHGEEAISISTEQGFPLWGAYGTMLQGWALVEQGQGEEGIVQIRQGLAAYLATGGEVGRPYWLFLLAEAYGTIAQPEEGLGILREALVLVDKTGERFYEAELHRLKGELLLLAADNEAEAEACLHQALEVARRQQAKSLELRAAMSLARLWQRQGKRGEARQLLEPIYSWFTEGFDTADLQEAKALLEELSSA
jgi:predicted ATPase